MEKQMNIPKLRFPEFKGEWEKKKLGKVAERVTAKNNSNNVKNVFTNSAVQGIVNQRDFFDKDIANQNNLLNYYVVEKDDFIYNPRISNLAPVGPISRNHIGTGVMSPLYSVFKFKDGELDFFETYFSTTLWYEYLESIANYGARFDRMNITIKDFYEMPLPFPTLPEQKRIASFFTVLDKKIAELKQKKNLLEQYKKGVMQKLFSQELSFKDENGKEFPKWEKLNFGKIYSFKTTNSLSRDKLNYELGAVKNIHYGDIHTRFKTLFDVSNEIVPFINLDIKLERIDKDNYCQIGDLVIADASEDYSDIGKAIEVVNLDNEKVLAGLHTILARPNKNKVSIGFGGYLMGIDYVQMQIRKIAQGTKVLGISSKKLSDIIINLPSKQEQTKIVGFIVSLDNKIYRTENQLQQTQQYKKGLLQNMFI